MSNQHAAVDRAFIKQQRQRLKALREQLMRGDKRVSQEDRAEMTEESEQKRQRMAENEVHRELHHVDEQRLRAIDRALQKIEDGTYGLSDVSGEPIPRDRLESVPEAVFTAQEEAQRESQHR